MEFAMQEAKDSKLLMEGLREENERHLNSIKRSMAKTKMELREFYAIIGKCLSSESAMCMYQSKYANEDNT